MDYANIFYTLAQVIHNFGAIAVVGGAMAMNFLPSLAKNISRKLSWLVLIGWALQAVSGAGFGAISYVYHGKFPDISSIAQSALLIKILCTMIGITLSSSYLYFFTSITVRKGQLVWKWLMAFSVIALTSAAFLRWFS